ncbi:MAG: hypothetical protein AAFY76_26325 [Cyanobacteria bacterium J06649_11]
MRLERDAQKKQANNNGFEAAIQTSSPVSAWPVEKDFVNSDVSICDKSKTFARLPSETSSKQSTVVSSFTSNDTEDSEANDEKLSTSTVRTLHISEAPPES